MLWYWVDFDPISQKVYIHNSNQETDSLKFSDFECYNGMPVDIDDMLDELENDPDIIENLWFR